LLNSVAAGLIVTRVQVDETSTLAGDLLRQLAQFKVARMFVAAAAFVLGVLPGMPHVVLLGVSILLCVSLLLPEPKQDAAAAKDTLAPFQPTLAQAISIEVNQAWVPSLPPITEISRAMEDIRQYAFTQWGLVLQRPGIALWNEALGAYRIRVRGREVFRCRSEQAETTWEDLRNEVYRVITLHRVDLIDDGATRRALDYVEREIPDLVNGVVPGVVSLTQMTALLRALLREGITTRHLDIILQTMAEYGSKVTERQLLAEVRVALAPVVSASVAIGGAINAAIIEPVIDLALGKAEENGALVSGELIDRICDQVEQVMQPELVLVASKRARAYLRDVVRVRWASIPVIAHEEIAPRFEVHSMGQIQLEDDIQRQALVHAMLQ
jgi:flagellar biosynthesis component FlhA